MVLLFSERGAEFSARHARPGNAPLTGAASGGHVDVICLCLERGAEIDGRPESPDSATRSRFNGTDTPLIAACRRLRLEAALVLLERGADVNMAGSDGGTPLYLACRIHRVNLVRLLIAHGADVHLTGQRHWGAWGAEFPLRIAIQRFPASKATVLALLEAGANPTLQHGRDDLTSMGFTGFTGSTLQARLTNGKTLHRLFHKWLIIMVRKYVIGPPAEHPSRRIEQLAPHIASFVALKFTGM